jgi:hypothetical protein
MKIIPFIKDCNRKIKFLNKRILFLKEKIECGEYAGKSFNIHELSILQDVVILMEWLEKNKQDIVKTHKSFYQDCINSNFVTKINGPFLYIKYCPEAYNKLVEYKIDNTEIDIENECWLKVFFGSSPFWRP